MPAQTTLTPEEKLKIKNSISSSSNKIFSAALARIYYAHPDPDKWSYAGLEGAVVLSKDNISNSLNFKLVDTDGTRGVVWEHELYDGFELYQDRGFFHSFAGDSCMIAFVYADEQEAKAFKKKVDSKKELATVKKTPSKSKSKKKANVGKGKIDKSMISGPQAGSFQHVAHMGYDAESGFSSKGIDPSWLTLLTDLEGRGVSRDVIAKEMDFIKSYVERAQEPPKKKSKPPPPPAPNRTSQIINGGAEKPPSPPPPPVRAPLPPSESQRQLPPALAPPAPHRTQPLPPSAPPAPQRTQPAPPAPQRTQPAPPTPQRTQPVPPAPQRTQPAPPTRAPEALTKPSGPPAPPRRAPLQNGGPPPPPTRPSLPATPPPTVVAPPLAPPPPPPFSGDGLPPPPPPPPPSTGDSPPPPPPPPPPAVDRGSAAPSLPPAQPGRTDLLASIRSSGGIGALKKAENGSPSRGSSAAVTSAAVAGGAAAAAAGAATAEVASSSGGGGDLTSALAAALMERNKRLGDSDSDNDDDDDDWD